MRILILYLGFFSPTYCCLPWLFKKRPVKVIVQQSLTRDETSLTMQAFLKEYKNIKEHKNTEKKDN